MMGVLVLIKVKSAFYWKNGFCQRIAGYILYSRAVGVFRLPWRVLF